MPKVPRLPRRSRGATTVLVCRQGSADIYKGPESTTPATQIEPEVPTVPQLPRRKPRRHNSPSSSPRFRGHLQRSRKDHTCHTNRASVAESITPATQKAAAPQQSYFVAKFPRTSTKVSKVPHLPHKSSQPCQKYHACHACVVCCVFCVLCCVLCDV